MNNNFAKFSKILNTQSLSSGFTLIELLVAMSLTVIAVGFTGFGLAAMMTKAREAEAKTQRRTEINRAIEFISNEVRMANRINRTANIIPNGTTITVNNVVAGANFNVSDFGTIVLYLEIPLPPTSCGNNSGPTSDKVVYDIRPNTAADFLGPQVIKRYGRTPEIDGTIDPCSNPSSETFIDAIVDANDNINPTCTSPAVRSGSGGFYACVNGRVVDLYLRNRVSDTEVENARTKVFSRIPPPSPSPSP